MNVRTNTHLLLDKSHLNLHGSEVTLSRRSKRLFSLRIVPHLILSFKCAPWMCIGVLQEKQNYCIIEKIYIYRYDYADK